MGRRKPNHLIAYVDEGGKLAVREYGEDGEAALEYLEAHPELQARAFDGVELPFRRGVIFAAAAPAPCKKPAARKKKQTNGASGTHFDADTGAPAAAKPQPHDVEA